ncbi:MAG: hypothetical protein ACEPOV_07075 [Hyphomicrobiales bacterium]
MLHRLLRKTLVPIQIIGYSITLLIGVAIILSVYQAYSDIEPIISKQSGAFKKNFAVLSKKTTLFQTINKEGIYFTPKEIKDIKNQEFVKDIAFFDYANFKVTATSNPAGNIPVFYTDLFFESVPNKFLDVNPTNWKWDSENDIIPVIVPEDYLNLYNFGFAESQGLPVLSKQTISKFSFNIVLSGNGMQGTYKSKIVGFTNRINSILVPENFLKWANEKYGENQNLKTSRILVEFNDPSDKTILEFVKKNNYSMNEDKLQLSKLTFFFKIAMLFVLFIAIVITCLSIGFIIISINLIIHKNKDTIINLYNIGYDHKEIAKYYQLIISGFTLISSIIAVIISYIARKSYFTQLQNYFVAKETTNHTFLVAVIITVIILILCNLIIRRNIKRAVICK